MSKIVNSTRRHCAERGAAPGQAGDTVGDGFVANRPTSFIGSLRTNASHPAIARRDFQRPGPEPGQGAVREEAVDPVVSGLPSAVFDCAIDRAATQPGTADIAQGAARLGLQGTIPCATLWGSVLPPHGHPSARRSAVFQGTP